MIRSLSALKRIVTIAAVAGSLIPSVLSAGKQPEPSQDFAGRVLTLHNRERANMGLPPLRWSTRLSQEAGSWASSLANRGAFEHSGQGDFGENLWMGSAEWFSPEQMVGAFLSERDAFRPGRFPHVSRTGNWTDVGHYTQVIWPQTQAVGCAIARSRGQDVMVCRYWPAGNVFGERVG
jgi:hypothetical protein